MTHITVTPTDIRKGVQNNPHSCAVARAIARTTKARVSVTASAIRLGEAGTLYAIENSTDGELEDWIEAFDNGEPVEPFQFDLVPA